jgi:ABC-2 type transport system permease protein
MGSVSLVALEVMFVNNTVYFLLLLFSGANIPLAVLPPWMQTISALLPLTRGIQSARLLAKGASLAEVWPLLVGETVVGLIYALLGFLLFSRFEAQAKRRGTMDAV